MKLEDFPNQTYCLGYGQFGSKCDECQNLKNWKNLNDSAYNGKITIEEFDSLKSQMKNIKIDPCVLSGRPHFISIVPLEKMN